MIDPRTVPGAERVAHVSTERAGGFGPRRDRWTEIGIWYLHEGMIGGKRWIVEHSGMSRIDGENTRYTRFSAGTLDAACRQIDGGKSAGAQVIADAIDWADAHRVTIENGRGKPLFFDDDAAALGWLYGQPDEGHTGYAKMLHRDTGAGESTVRMQIAAGRPVMVPLRNILRFVDRDAFRRARGGDAARG